jgi:hypothetical protein
MRSLAAAVVRIDDRLREWPVTGVLLAALTLALAVALLSGS